MLVKACRREQVYRSDCAAEYMGQHRVSVHAADMLFLS
jgi:hypothetical protein